MALVEGLGEKLPTDACFDNILCPMQVGVECQLPLF